MGKFDKFTKSLSNKFSGEDLDRLTDILMERRNTKEKEKETETKVVEPKEVVVKKEIVEETKSKDEAKELENKIRKEILDELKLEKELEVDVTDGDNNDYENKVKEILNRIN